MSTPISDKTNNEAKKTITSKVLGYIIHPIQSFRSGGQGSSPSSRNASQDATFANNLSSKEAANETDQSEHSNETPNWSNKIVGSKVLDYIMHPIQSFRSDGKGSSSSPQSGTIRKTDSTIPTALVSDLSSGSIQQLIQGARDNDEDLEQQDKESEDDEEVVDMEMKELEQQNKDREDFEEVVNVGLGVIKNIASSIDPEQLEQNLESINAQIAKGDQMTEMIVGLFPNAAESTQELEKLMAKEEKKNTQSPAQPQTSVKYSNSEVGCSEILRDCGITISDIMKRLSLVEAKKMNSNCVDHSDRLKNGPSNIVSNLDITSAIPSEVSLENYFYLVNLTPDNISIQSSPSSSKDSKAADGTVIGKFQTFSSSPFVEYDVDPKCSNKPNFLYAALNNISKMDQGKVLVYHKNIHTAGMIAALSCVAKVAAKATQSGIKLGGNESTGKIYDNGTINLYAVLGHVIANQNTKGLKYQDVHLSAMTSMISKIINPPQ
ncbi:MAG: hypothetical protein LBI81_02685 [Puniceicoccales bacterium]|jgi:hypothetical protein|nr:hypothetical protein [Puniceicoccales bacterium]